MTGYEAQSELVDSIADIYALTPGEKEIMDTQNCSRLGCNNKAIEGFVAWRRASDVGHHQLSNNERIFWCEDHKQESMHGLGEGRFIFPVYFPLLTFDPKGPPFRIGRH
jgi:hypothetical protein